VPDYLQGGAMSQTDERAPSELLNPRKAELTERVEWFIVLRWMAVAGILVAVPAGKYILKLENIAEVEILLLATFLLLLNCGYALAARSIHRREMDGEAHDRAIGLFVSIQIVLDLLILTALLHFSGGIQNPFSFYYVFHVVLASILLSRRSAFVVAGLGTSLYSIMLLLEHFGLVSLRPIEPVADSYSTGYVAVSILAIGSTLFFGVYMATSITARLQKKEAELAKALRDVRDLEANKSRFLMLVSHEMKSPIVAVRSILDALYLTSKDCLGQRGAQMLRRASERADSLLTLTKDLLTLARQQTGTADAVAMPVDMLNLTRSCLQLFRTQAEQRGISLREDYPKAPVTVTGDPNSLNMLIDNLVSNAIRYTPAGGQVSVGWRVEERRGVLSVVDTGIGIPEAEMPIIFQDFFRAQNAKKFTASGTGLGLAIAKNIVERAGGAINVSSVEGKGTTFTVTLPIAATPGKATQEPPQGD